MGDPSGHEGLSGYGGLTLNRVAFGTSTITAIGAYASLAIAGAIVVLLVSDCGCLFGENTLVPLELIAAVTTYTAGLFYFADKGNIKNHIYWEALRQAGNNRDKLCELLEAWYNQAKTTQEKMAIKLAQKAAGCRHSRQSK